MTARSHVVVELDVYEWDSADRSYEEADARAVEAARRALPPGMLVRWEHGKHQREAEVVEVGSGPYHYLRVWVRSLSSGKEFWLSASTILGYERRAS